MQKMCSSDGEPLSSRYTLNAANVWASALYGNRVAASRSRRRRSCIGHGRTNHSASAGFALRGSRPELRFSPPRTPPRLGWRSASCAIPAAGSRYGRRKSSHLTPWNSDRQRNPLLRRRSEHAWVFGICAVKMPRLAVLTVCYDVVSPGERVGVLHRRHLTTSRSIVSASRNTTSRSAGCSVSLLTIALALDAVRCSHAYCKAPMSSAVGSNPASVKSWEAA
jgi:hypothetical protein